MKNIDFLRFKCNAHSSNKSMSNGETLHIFISLSFFLSFFLSLSNSNFNHKSLSDETARTVAITILITKIYRFVSLYFTPWGH